MNFHNNLSFELMTNVISGINSINKIDDFLQQRNYKKRGNPDFRENKLTWFYI